MNNSVRTAFAGTHILSKDIAFDTDTWETQVNNNVLIIGPSGAGKTRNYVMPNLRNCHESIIVSDTKGSLYKKFRDELESRGYEVVNIDFSDLGPSRGCSGNTIGYNPLDYIRFDPETGKYNEQDIMSLAATLVPNFSRKDPYWDEAARQYLCVLIAYVLETLPTYQHNLEYVHKVMLFMTASCLENADKPNAENRMDMIMHELEINRPGSTTVSRYRALKAVATADRMFASIHGILSTALDPLCFDGALALYKRKGRICFEDIGRRKIAVFLTVSDNDRSMDSLVKTFITQAFQRLIRYADKECAGNYLPVPVRVFLDDFATNYTIPDFDNLISVIRSREIYVSVILQSLTQLDALYDKPRAMTIINNCDSLLYLGGQDLETAEYIAKRANKPLEEIVTMPIDKAFLLRKGQKAVFTKKCPCPPSL